MHFVFFRAQQRLQSRLRRFPVAFGHHLRQKLRCQRLQPRRKLFPFRAKQLYNLRFRARLALLGLRAFAEREKVQALHRSPPLLPVNVVPKAHADGNVRQHPPHRFTVRRGDMPILRFRNILRHLNSVLSYRTKPISQFLTAISSHAPPRSVFFPPDSRTRWTSLRAHGAAIIFDAPRSIASRP